MSKRWEINMIFCMKINIKVFESPKTMRKMCLSTKFPYHEIRWNYGILHSEVFKIYAKKERKDEINFLCRWASQFSANWYYHFWWVWLRNISKKNWVMKSMFCMMINMKDFQCSKYVQSSPTLDHFPLSIWNPSQAFS